MGLPVVADMGSELASVASHFALLCSILDRCANQEGYYNTLHGDFQNVFLILSVIVEVHL